VGLERLGGGSSPRPLEYRKAVAERIKNELRPTLQERLGAVVSACVPGTREIGRDAPMPLRENASGCSASPTVSQPLSTRSPRHEQLLLDMSTVNTGFALLSV
jgi:hypothetical protein